MMKFFFIVIVVFVSVMGNDHYNKKEFEHLCKILKVAEGEPQKIPDELRNITETRHILQRLLRATKTSSSTYQKVVQLKSDDKEDTEFISYTVKRRIANEKIQHAMEKVKDIYSRMEEELIQATNERTLARNNLVHAIYGVQVGELPQDKEITDVLKNISRSSISNDNGGEKKVKYHEAKMEKPCGGAGESGAGFTLINDFYCLCVGKENAKAVCHEKIRGPCCCCCGVKCQDCKCEKNCDDCKCKNCDGCEDCKLHNKWLSLFDVNKSKIVDIHDGWPHIREACNETFRDQVNTTAESIQDVLDDFNKFLGGNNKTTITPKNANMDSRRLFVLGHVKEIDSNKGCTGKGDEDAICVNYWAVSNLGSGIVWQNYMLEAQKHLQAMDKHVQKALQLSLMIQKLKESAEESYRNSRHGSMIWPLEEGFSKNNLHPFFLFFACFLYF